MVRLGPYFAAAPFHGRSPRTLILIGAFAALLLACAVITPAKAAPRCATGDPKILAHSGGGRISFGGKTQMVALTPTCGPIGAAVRRAGAKTRFFLLVEDLRAAKQPGAIFDITLAPSHFRAEKHMRMLGTLNFFNAHPAGAGKGRNVSYDMTAQLRALARRGSLPHGIGLAIGPMSTLERASDASAGAIKLVVQPG